MLGTILSCNPAWESDGQNSFNEWSLQRFSLRNKDRYIGKQDRWMYKAIITTFSTVYQRYQGDVRVIRKGYVQWNTIYGEQNTASNRIPSQAR